MKVDPELQKAIEGLRKAFGEHILMTMKDAPLSCDVISTGSLNVDLALGVGGVPRGRITEIYGPESAGKTTLAQHIVAEAQRGDGVAVYVDMEHKVDPEYAKNCGVDMDELYFSQPRTGTQALDIARRLISTNKVDAIIIDSVSALSTSAELDADAGDQFVGVQARLMSQNLKAIIPALGLSKTALIFINQTRMKIGQMYGNPETTSGGKALKFYATVRMRIGRIGTLGKTDHEHGIKSRVRVTKNNVAPPWQTAEIDIEWGKGIDAISDVLDAATRVQAISSGGGYYKFGDVDIGRGRPEAKEFLRQNPEIVAQIRAAVLEGRRDGTEN